MKRLLFYILRVMAFLSRCVSRKMYGHLIMMAHKIQGVHFVGVPEYIDFSAHLDASGGLSIGKGVVISTHAVILSHDWSFLIGVKANFSKPRENFLEFAYKEVEVCEHSFIGAGAIVLPGSKIGKYYIIGAGAVVKGKIEDYSIVVGNPSKCIKNTSDWGKQFAISQVDFK